jgi:hypothetical protein
MQQASLRLFNAIQVDEPNPRSISRDVTEHTIRHGYVLDPAITPDEKLLKIIDSVIGLSGEQANAAFHKSWQVIQTTSTEALVLQQITHYITTYGFEDHGIYHKDTVYIPREILDLPEIQEDIPLIIVTAMDGDKLLEAILNLASGIALSPETLSDIMKIVEGNNFDSTFVERVGNRELKTMLFDYYGLIPDEPVEFLRHLISKLTDESLLIKNNLLIEKIKKSNGKFLDVLLEDAPDNLASIFYRYKPLFLALKSISRNKTFFNRLRKQAPRLHQPLSEDYLGSVTSQLKRNILKPEDLRNALEKASVFRKVRLVYALKHRLQSGNSIVYRIRNGRGWATEFDWPQQLATTTQSALDIVLESLVSDIRPNIENKTVFIPPFIRYALPASEKLFTGNVPTGSSIIAPDNLIVGIHWLNTKKRIDLDLSVIGESGKFGWDGNYRSKDRAILFSGDMTDAPPPNGATELFYLKGGLQESMILMLNFYNYAPGDEVEAKILVANESPKKFDQNYMVDPNNIVFSANINVTKKQNILGLIAAKNGKTRVYFSHVSIGTSITSSNNTQSAHARSYLVQSQLDTIDLKQVLIMAGATVSNEKTGAEDFDLSPESLDKSTIIGLLK